ncbi:MAG: hypothetical protein LBQ88_20650 [Treponema sp.]|jgi:hypothetical protein|nr:hypothetical protein [Treponema sp.]
MEDISTWEMAKILNQYPFAQDWLTENGFILDPRSSFAENLQGQTKGFFQNNGCNAPEFTRRFRDYIHDMVEFLGETPGQIEEITILPGLDKSGRRENFERITIKRGSIAAVRGGRHGQR